LDVQYSPYAVICRRNRPCEGGNSEGGDMAVESDADRANPRIRAGIVGTGFIAGVHAHAVRAAGGEVVAVLGSSPEATARGAVDMAARRGAADLHALVADDDIDAIHICTPNATHRALAEAAIAAGKHVICEKPLATSVPDARLLTELARAANVLASVPFTYRFYASVRDARDRIHDDASNPLWMLHGSYLQDWLAGAELTNWRVDPAQGGASRAFGDIGVHWCDLMEFTTGHRITRLTARMGSAFGRRGTGSSSAEVRTEDGAVVVFETDRGALGSVVVSQVSPGRKNQLWFSFDGPERSYAFNQETPDTLWLGDRAQTRLLSRGNDVGAQAGSPYSRLPAGHPQGYQDAFNAYIGDFYAGVAGEKPDGLPTFDDGLRAAVVTQAVVDSAATQTWVEVAA
jgi:predicted dehydrogenase